MEEIINIKKILKSKETWKKEYDKTYDYFRNHFGEKNCFRKRVIVNLENDKVKMFYQDYLVNLMMWKPMIKFKMVPTTKQIFDCDCIKDSSISNYLNKVYVRPLREKVKISELNLELAEVIEELKTINEEFGLLIGVHYNLYQINQLRKSNKRFNELLNIEIPKGLQPNEVEEFLNNCLAELKDILKHSKTGFAPLLNSGVGINEGQLKELLLPIGNKPDLEGNTFPFPIKSSIINGFDTPSDYYIDATGGRKALIMNKKYTGRSGYFSRKIHLMCLDTVLDQDPKSDCHTKKLLRYKIDDMESLARIEGRYYRSRPSSSFERIIQITDTHLIGKTIYLRSPAYCANPKICHKCYGKLYNNNKEINIGLLAASIITSRFTQNILSSKHLLRTKSIKIVLSDNYEKYFILDGNGIMIDINNDDKIENKFLTIDSRDLRVDVLDDQIDEETNIPITIDDQLYSSKVYITGQDPNDVYLKIEEMNGLSFEYTDYMSKLISKYDRNKRYIQIPIQAIDENEILMEINVANSELTKTLNLVKELLEKDNHGDCDNIEDMVYRFNRLLIEGKIYSHLVHAEVICRNLMRDPNNILERPDFNKSDASYIILTVQKALMNNPSPLISLSFERVKDQLKKVSTFTKTKPSMIDKLYMESYNHWFNEDIFEYKCI